MKAYEYLGIKSLTDKNWYEMCEVLCNNAYTEILRIKSLSRTFSDETVASFSDAVLAAIDALQTVCTGGKENA